MAANTSPIFTLTPHFSQVSISTANTNRDGTGTLGSVSTGAVNGTRVEWLMIKATGTTTAGMIRLFIYDGTNTYIFDEVAVSAVTPSATVATFSFVFTPNKPIILPSNYILKASTHNAETFIVQSFAGDF